MQTFEIRYPLTVVDDNHGGRYVVDDNGRCVYTSSGEYRTDDVDAIQAINALLGPVDMSAVEEIVWDSTAWERD